MFLFFFTTHLIPLESDVFVLFFVFVYLDNKKYDLHIINT